MSPTAGSEDRGADDPPKHPRPVDESARWRQTTQGRDDLSARTALGRVRAFAMRHHCNLGEMRYVLIIDMRDTRQDQSQA